MILFRNNILGKIAFFVLLFLFVYPFKLVGLPASFRVLFSVAGAVWLGVRMLALQKTYVSLQVVRLAVCAVAICLMSVASVYVFNHTGDPEFVNFWLMPTFCFLSSYFVISFGLLAFPQLDFYLLSKYFVAVVLAQALLSAAMFLVPNIYTALLGIQQMDELDMLKSEQSIGSRLMGLGASFMIMGVINCVALLLIAILLKGAPMSKPYRIYLILAYLAIFAIGMMQSRTTVVGLLVSLAYLCVSSLRIGVAGTRKALSRIGSIVLVSLTLLLLLLVAAKDFIEENRQIINYGFEMLVNLQEKGKLESASTNQLQDMYVYPEHAKTYFVGDGRYNVVPGVTKYGFYMHTDVGFLRLLYYFGMPGLLLFSLYQFLLVKYSFSVPLPNYKFLIFYFFLFVVLWNLKNTMDANILFTPFCVLNILLARRRLAHTTFSPQAQQTVIAA